ncbi:MAG: inositol monophosphatase family protein [Gammaproteobacteria bacterium]|jgi:inositol-phosphate phosphatase/L-galactose 1-phosphate phosphatase/histidinol-phosphatase|nr:inositol monophosphatase family protein [Gammaproteobacteria bacterium]
MTSDHVNSDDLIAFAESLADEARAILDAANASPTDIQYKADDSPVTDLDRRIEARMRALIDDRYPQHGILGEELGNRDLDAELVWVLDPIDGTAPFIAGIPVYGTLIGLARRGRPFIGVIDHPATDDRWVGVAGSYARHNGKAVHTRRCERLADAFVTNSNPDFFSSDEMSAFTGLKSRVRYMQYGGSCYAYAMLASGRTDIGLDANFDPFDVFAPAAVIEGAGGIVSDWSGKGIDLQWQGRILAAGDPRMHAQALSALKEGFSQTTEQLSKSTAKH